MPKLTVQQEKDLGILGLTAKGKPKRAKGKSKPKKYEESPVITRIRMEQAKYFYMTGTDADRAQIEAIWKDRWDEFMALELNIQMNLL